MESWWGLPCLAFLCFLMHARGQRDFDLADALDDPEPTKKPNSGSRGTWASWLHRIVMPRPLVPQRRPPESRVKAKRQGSLLQVRTWSLHSTAYKRALNNVSVCFL
ncbi:glycoprotein Xg isoform X1 [Pan paniscus]|uniref:glycoprotein Xg isoform X1 n=1 Tax=Pan paniscus TaxID=9597 RepID=UPI0030042BCC